VPLTCMLQVVPDLLHADVVIDEPQPTDGPASALPPLEDAPPELPELEFPVLDPLPELDPAPDEPAPEPAVEP